MVLFSLAFLLPCFCMLSPSSPSVQEVHDYEAAKQIISERSEPLGAVAVFFLDRQLPSVAKKVARRDDVAKLFGAILHVPVETSVAQVWDRGGSYAGEGVERVCVFYRHLERSRSHGGLFDPPAWRKMNSVSDWSEESLAAWMQERAYPLVNFPARGVFSGPKYVDFNRFGLVLVSMEQLIAARFGNHAAAATISHVLEELIPWAKLYRRKLKFSLFTCAPQSLTAEVCHRLGMGSQGIEIVLIEEPHNLPPTRTNVKQLPGNKFLLPATDAGQAGGIRQFFEKYSSGKLLPYYVSAPAIEKVPGLHALRGDEVRSFVGFSGSGLGALVLFWAIAENSDDEMTLGNHQESGHLLGSFQELQRRHKKRLGTLARLGTLDCRLNEHPFIIPRLPWIRWFPAHGGTPHDVESRYDADALLDFLEDRRAEEIEELDSG